MDVKKLHYLFFLTVVVFAFLRLFSNNQNTFVVNVHDIYYVVGCADLYFFFAVFNTLLGLIYLIFLLLKGSILRLLYQIHIYGTLIAQLLFFYYNYKNNLDNQFNIFDVMDYNAKMIYVLLIIILLQILLIINIFVSLIKKRSNSPNSYRDSATQEMNKNYYAIIMAGGVGSRFWPVSTTEFPKQFHDMLGAGSTLIQKTFSRLSKLVPAENILVLTNERYNDIVLEQLPLLKPEQVLLEPVMRNTAPCILYASLKIQKQNPNAVMVVAPSDHWIEDEVAFAENLKTCFDYCATENALMTLGIQPTFPNTGFGYIEYNKAEPNAIKKVTQFREKPDYETAKSFLEAGNFLWNGGIFIWSAKSITEAFEKFQPQMNTLFLQGFEVYNTDSEKQFITDNYDKAENISIDYAVMEKATNVYVLPATFDWNDLGTWGQLHDKIEKDENNNGVINAKVIFENASNNIVRSDADKIIVIDGLHDYIIVDKEGVLLIYPKSKEQDIKRITSLANNL